MAGWIDLGRTRAMKSAPSWLATVLLATALLLAGQVSQAAELPFDAGHSLALEMTEAQQVVAADLTGDGLTDVVAAAKTLGVVRMWTATGGGGFTNMNLALGLDAPSYLDLADLDFDGDLDVVVGQSENVSGPGNGELLWLANPLIGVNTSWTRYVIQNYANNRVDDIVCADVDEDGDVDVVVATGINDIGIQWLENDGTPANGGWSIHDIDADSSALSLTVADVDGDGDLDVVSGIGGANQINWWEHDGVPTDDWTSHEIDGGLGILGDVECADVTGDGAMDVVATVPTIDTVGLWEASGTSWIQRNLSVPSDNYPSSVEIVDLDADGDLDVLTAVLYTNTVQYYENTDGSGGAWLRRTINDDMDDAWDAVTGDLDGDGDLDVVATGIYSDDVKWFENRVIHRELEYGDPVDARTGMGEPRGVEMGDINRDGLVDMVVAEWDDDTITVLLGINPDAGLWLEQTVVSSFDRVRDVALVDLDRDGDLDVVGAALGSDQVWWWENDGSAFPSWTSHPILNSFDGAHAVEPADIDGDGDVDLFVVGFDGDEAAWVMNANGVGTSWIEYPITSVDGGYGLVVGDLNGDRRPDAVVSAYEADTIKVLLNPYGSGDFWNVVTVDTGINGPREVALGDLDGDGDEDIVAALRLANEIVWYANSGAGLGWTQDDVGSGLLIDGAAVETCDIDQDGDVDVLASSQSQSDIWLWENGGDGSAWNGWKFETSLASPWALRAADVDQDGWMDLAVAAGGSADSVLWYPSIGGQFEVGSWSVAPSTLLSDSAAAIVEFVLWHKGVVGADSAINPVSFVLGLQDDSGTALSSSQANAIIDQLEVWADSDDNGMWSDDDTLLLTDTYLSMSGGAVTETFTGTLPEQQVPPASSTRYFVVITASPDAHDQTPGAIRATFRDADVVAEDLTYEVPVVATPGAAVATGLITFISTDIFHDGFESGDTTQWTGYVP
jgi:hypothetical protein